MSIDWFMDQLATVYRNNSTTADNGGLIIPSWATHLSSVPCSIQKERGGNNPGMVQGSYSDTTIYLEAGHDVTHADEIAVNGRRFQILYIDPDVAEASEYMRMTVREASV